MLAAVFDGFLVLLGEFQRAGFLQAVIIFLSNQQPKERNNKRNGHNSIVKKLEAIEKESFCSLYGNISFV